MKNQIISFLIFICSVNITFAENPYIRNGSIGKQTEKVETSLKKSLSSNPTESWIGERFIFLPKPKILQKNGYSAFKRVNYDSPTYEECVGRIGKIIEIGKDDSEKIKIQMEDNGQIYIGSGDFMIEGIAPVEDIDNARTKWLRKTLWVINNLDQVAVTYDENSGKSGTIKVKRFSPIKVTNIVAGWFSVAPVRFIIQTPTGEEAFIDIDLSGTNIPPELHVLRLPGLDTELKYEYIVKYQRKYFEKLRGTNIPIPMAPRFEDIFRTDDPKKTYQWSDKVWSAIEDRKIFIGMTTEQVLMSIGKPDKINRTTTVTIKHEQWIYTSKENLYFENNILTSIQN